MLKAYGTGSSQAVPHPSTIPARRCLTSVIRRERVCSSWYGRRQRLYVFLSFYIISSTQSVNVQVWGRCDFQIFNFFQKIYIKLRSSISPSKMVVWSPYCSQKLHRGLYFANIRKIFFTLQPFSSCSPFTGRADISNFWISAIFPSGNCNS